jgi:LysR family hydrogen peroxide-inducible transcriptional activator
MSLRDYEYILTVARERHFGRAADICNVSQPTLSMQIKKWENRHELQLFERTNKTVALTHDGEKIIRHIKTVINAERSLNEEIRKLQSPDSGEYIIGAFPTLAPFLLPRIMPEISNDFPNVKLYLIEERSADLIERLEDHSLDAAFLALPFAEQDHYTVMELFSEPFYAALPIGHPLAKHTALELADLKDEKLLLLEDSHCLSGQALEVCEWAGLKSAHDFRATSIETLRQMVASGLGITLIPEMAVDPQHNRIAYIPLSGTPAPGRRIGLVWRKHFAHADFLQNIGKIVESRIKNTSY